jgi:hypothetical protein
MADRCLVNSQYTAQVYRDTFPVLRVKRATQLK